MKSVNVAVLTSSDPALSQSNFDDNFCRLAEYYGTSCKRIDYSDPSFGESSLKDDNGRYYRIVTIDAKALSDNQPSSFGSERLKVLTVAVESGLNLIVGNIAPGSYPGLSQLSDGSITGVKAFSDSRFEWQVSSAAPEVTRQLSGKRFSSHTESQKDSALVFGEAHGATRLIDSISDSQGAYPVFAKTRVGQGTIFFLATEQDRNISERRLIDSYYDIDNFSKTVPIMMALRWALGDYAWHSNYNFANLTIDDPALREPWMAMSYSQILQEMLHHPYHLTIAFIPINVPNSQPEVITSFINNPTSLSLVQHGNNHDGYEFYKYTIDDNAPVVNTLEVEGGDSSQVYPPRPFLQQKANIEEGFRRLQGQQFSTGLFWGRIMIFPYAIAPERTLSVLKEMNYLASVNAQDRPIDVAAAPERWDFNMQPVILDYANFPLITRRHPGTYEPFKPDPQTFFLDLFIGKAALSYSHENELYKDKKMDAFNSFADQLNSVSGGVQWQSLDYIVRRLSLEKLNSDGSKDLQMYSNYLIVENKGPSATYHVAKIEDGKIPIKSLTVNGQPFLYRLEDGKLLIDIVVPEKSSVELQITYGQ